MVTIPSRAQTAGIPRQHDDTIVAADIYLITGNEPAVMTKDEIVAFSQTIAALTVVGKNAAGEIVPAVLDTGTPANSIKPIGIAVIAITTTGSGDKKGLPVYRAGCFNPDALVWPASFDTEAKKQAAFEGSPAPTNIILRRPKTYTV
jgi:hypothetical protein